MNRTVKTMIYCALFAALTAVCSQLAIPIQPVPINLALLSVYIAGGLLGGGMGAASQAVFLLIGAVGVPVFAGFRGGVQALVGPTGGYLIAPGCKAAENRTCVRGGHGGVLCAGHGVVLRAERHAGIGGA